MAADRFTPARPARRSRQRRGAIQRTGLALVVAGIALFLASNLGARAGFAVLPFDPHHVIGQFVGPLFAVLGASLMSRRRA